MKGKLHASSRFVDDIKAVSRDSFDQLFFSNIRLDGSIMSRRDIIKNNTFFFNFLAFRVCVLCHPRLRRYVILLNRT